jgi:hypothetical protein
MTSVKSLQKQLLAAVAMVLVAAIAMSSATYAWFVNNAQVTATDVNVQAASAYSLLISHENGEKASWGTTTQMKNTLTTLIPVSTVGEINQGAVSDGATTDDGAKAITLTKSDTAPVGIGDGKEVKVGDVRFVTNTGWGQDYITTVSEVSRESGYFYSDTVYLKAAQAGAIFLDSSNIGINWADFDSTTGAVKTTTTFYKLADFAALKPLEAAQGEKLTTNQEAYNEALASAQALLKTLRVGLLVTQTGEDSSSNVTYARTWHEFELNSSVLDDATDANTTLKGNDNVNGIANALSAKASSEEGAGSATDSAPVVAAITTAHMSSTTNIASYGLTGSSNSMPKVSSNSSAVNLATVAANEEVQVDIYIWMEGCDFDTVAANINSFAGTGVKGFQLGFCLGDTSTT